MSYSTLFKLDSSQLNSEAEVETRLLAKLFNDLGYPDQAIIPKKHLKPLHVNDGFKRHLVQVDFILYGQDSYAKVVVEAKDPKKSISISWGQAASYALSYNSDKPDIEKIKWLLISNGHITSLFKHDSITPIVTLQLSDFASGSPPYVALRSYIKHHVVQQIHSNELIFETTAPNQLNKLFERCHDLIWKKEKLSPTDAFFEFCKFIFIKIREDKKREKLLQTTPAYELPMTIAWLDAQKSTSKHPVRDILFKNLRDDLEKAIHREKKKKIFEHNETLKLTASTCRELINKFQTINLSSIDEDLNGRMFEVFLNAAIRGPSLGQYFTPRPVVDFMTRLAMQNVNIEKPPMVIDACSGTAGFLIEVMAYLFSGLRNDTRFTNIEQEEIKNLISNDRLFGIEANERVARIARINMYLHGDGGNHIFHGDGLDSMPETTEDMTDEKKDEVQDHIKKVLPSTFDLVLTNPPFSMTYKFINEDEKKILNQRSLADRMPSVKSGILFLDRYHELLKCGGEMFIILDDTVLNGQTLINIRKWILDKFILLGVHSLPFNTFFKAKANIKTSILHVRKKLTAEEKNSHVFMSISNNVGHNNSLKDTPERNNLTDILVNYIEWKRTGKFNPVFKPNYESNENLECPEQIWLVPTEKITHERLDAFFYAPELISVWHEIRDMDKEGKVEPVKGNQCNLVKKLTKAEKIDLAASQTELKYIEISDVTSYGLITNYRTGKFAELPSRAEYQIRKGDVLFAINNSSRGTVVIVPPEFDGAMCTSGFYVIRPGSEDEGYLLWYALRSELCRKQIYYLAQTASQPELKLDTWRNHFLIPIPKDIYKNKAIKESKTFFTHIQALINADNVRLSNNQ